MILLSPYLISIFIVEIIILILGSIALFWALKIVLEFDINEANEHQYMLMSKSYLIATIILFILAFKLPIFLYFIWTMDSLSDLVPGAMCATGIVSATSYGSFMLALKIVNLFLLCGWILLHVKDMKSIDSKFLKLKFALYQPLFLFLVLEFILEIVHFTNISTTDPVACCSVIFSQNPFLKIPFYKSHSFILGLFFGTYILHVISGFLKHAVLFGLFSFMYALSCMYALIRFFSPYVYELPTHLCPFCLLQSQYYYIGYIIYILLFLGALFGFYTLLLRLLKQEVSQKYYTYGVVNNTILLLTLVYYPLSYYLKNGVWL